MAKEKFKFKREHGSGLKNSAVYVGETRLEFVKDEAEIELKLGETVDVYWRLEGKQDASFKLTYKKKGEDDVTITSKSDITKKKSRKSNFAFITPK